MLTMLKRLLAAVAIVGLIDAAFTSFSFRYANEKSTF